MSQPIAVRLPDDLAQRLNALSERTRRPKAIYIREALEYQLDRIEWEQGIATRREDTRSGRSETTTGDNVRHQLGLDS